MQTQIHPVQRATDLKERVEMLEMERAASSLVGLDADVAFMDDLLQELHATRSAYVGAAVTEIASLRAALHAPLVG